MQKRKLFMLFLLSAAIACTAVVGCAETLKGVGQGAMGEICVSVVTKDGIIQSVDVIEHSETVGISDSAIENIPLAIVEANSASVDAISGATKTSEGIIEAVENALGLSSVEEKTAQDCLDELYLQVANVKEKYAPKIVTLSNGVTVQRTPNDSVVYNNKILKADERGCFACHQNLYDVLDQIESTSPNYIWHHATTRSQDENMVEMTVQQCYTCHCDNDRYGYHSLMPILHGVHDNDAFAEAGGTCWSCHVVNETTGKMELWDLTKHEVLKGITKIHDVAGEFSYDQNVLTEKVFNQAGSWVDYQRLNYYKTFLGEKPDPENDGVYDSWMINVLGNVDQPLSLSLSDLLQVAPLETTTMTFHCVISPVGGALVSNLEITGIPLSWLLENAGMREDSEMLWLYKYDGAAPEFDENGDLVLSKVPVKLQDVEKYGAYLVIEINGEPIDYAEGYPCMLMVGGGTAGDSCKSISSIVVTNHTAEDVQFDEEYDDMYDNNGQWPSVGICHLYEGQIISADEAYTFEGYANSIYRDVVAVEFSFDQGETWTSFDTSESTGDKWVYWYFTWTPPKAGSYTIRVRCIDEEGNITPTPEEIMITVAE